MSTAQKVHVDKYLTGLSLGYKNEDLIADQLFPSVKVEKQSDKYLIWGKERFNTPADLRAPGTTSNEVHWSFSDDQFYCDAHALSAFIPDEEFENADAEFKMEIEQTYSDIINDNIRLNKEVDAAKKLTDPSMIDASLHTSLSSAPWNDYTASNPQLDVINADKKIHILSGIQTNVLVLSKDVYDALLLHTKLIKILGVNQLQMLTHQMLETILGKRIIVGRAMHNVSKDDRAPKLEYVWGSTAVLMYINPKVMGKKTLTTGLCFEWNKPGSGAVSARKWYREDEQATKIEVEYRYDQKIVAKDTSFIFTDAYKQ